MPDYRTLFDSEFLRAWDLQGRAVTVTIERVAQGSLTNHQKGKSEKKPFVWFKGKSKPLGLNRTNSKTIAAMYGKATEDWVGKSVTLYPTTTSFGAEHGIDCIRIKPAVPTGKPDTTPLPEPPAQEPAQ